MEVQFNNVTISIKADTPQGAYTVLCNVLARGLPNIEWTTDTYVAAGVERSTEELFPKDDDATERA